MGFRRFARVAGMGIIVLLSACETSEPQQPVTGKPEPPDIRSAATPVQGEPDDAEVAVAPNSEVSNAAPSGPAILAASDSLQCVPYARGLTGFPIFGNAATWWLSAYGVYRRSSQPTPGAVMVFRSSRRNPFGHLAVVSTVLNDRKILVDHANWLNQGRIHRSAPVVDVSRNNDWSAVRVWYTPGRRLGAHTFPVAGFIHQEKIPSGERFRTIVNANVRQKPSRKARRVARLPKQTTVELLERVAGRPWFRIARDGREIGYVFAPLVKPES